MRHLGAAHAEQVLVAHGHGQAAEIERPGDIHLGPGDPCRLHPRPHRRRGHRHAGFVGDLQRDGLAGGIGEVDEQVVAGAHGVRLVVDDHGVLGAGSHAAGQADGADLRQAGGGGLGGAAAGQGDGIDRRDSGLRHGERHVHRVGQQQQPAGVGLHRADGQRVVAVAADGGDGHCLGTTEDPQHAVFDLDAEHRVAARLQRRQQRGHAARTVVGVLAFLTGGHLVDHLPAIHRHGVGGGGIGLVGIEVDAAGAQHAHGLAALDQAVQGRADRRPAGGHGHRLVGGAVGGVVVDVVGQLLRHRGQRVAAHHRVAEEVAVDGDAEHHAGAHRQARQADAALGAAGGRDIGARQFGHRGQPLGGDRDGRADRVAVAGLGQRDDVARAAGVHAGDAVDRGGQLLGQGAAAGVHHGGAGRAHGDDVARADLGGQAGHVDGARVGVGGRDGGRAQVGRGRPVERIDGDGAAAAAGHPDPGVVAHRCGVFVAVDHHRIALAADRADAVVERDHAALLHLAAGGRGRRAAAIGQRPGAHGGDRLDGGDGLDDERSVGHAGIEVQRVGGGIHRHVDARPCGLDGRLQTAQQRRHRLVGQRGDGGRHTVDGDGVDLARGGDRAEHDAAALGGIGAGRRGRGRGHRRRHAAGAFGGRVGHLPVGNVDRDAQRCVAGGNHPHFQFVAGAGVGGRAQQQCRRHGRADDGDGETVQIGRRLVVGLGHQVAARVDDACLQFGDHAHRLDRDGTGGLARTGIGSGLDQVDAQVAARSHLGNIGRRIDEGAHLACIHVATGLDAHGAIACGGALDHQPIGLTHRHVAIHRAVGHQRGDQGVEHDVAFGRDLQAVGDEHRRAVGHHLVGLDQDVAAVCGVGIDDAALHRERAAHQQVDVGRRPVAGEAADEARQREAAAQVEIDVTPGAQLETGRRQRGHADVDEAGVLQALVLLDGVEDAAVAVVVDAQQGLAEGVQAVAITVQVDAEAGLGHVVQRVAIAIQIAVDAAHFLQRVGLVAVAVEVAAHGGFTDEVEEVAIQVVVDRELADGVGVVAVAIEVDRRLMQPVGAVAVAVQVDAEIDF